MSNSSVILGHKVRTILIRMKLHCIRKTVILGDKYTDHGIEMLKSEQESD